jgi:hyperosmotically inducible periplasmic protein
VNERIAPENAGAEMRMKPRGAYGMTGFLIVAVIVVALGGCRTPAGRTAGDVVDDATSTSKVKAKLLEDGVLKGLGISVDTFEGQVTLTGAVPNEEQRGRAEAITRSVYGVKKVNNLLNIRKS